MTIILSHFLGPEVVLVEHLRNEIEKDWICFSITDFMIMENMTIYFKFSPYDLSCPLLQRY